MSKVRITTLIDTYDARSRAAELRELDAEEHVTNYEERLMFLLGA